VTVVKLPVKLIVPVTFEAVLLPSGVMVVEFNVPVTALLPFEPNGVMVVEFKVPVTAEVEFMPAGVRVCVCAAKAEPANVGCVNVPAAIVGGFVGHEIAPCVNAPPLIAPGEYAPLLATGTGVGHATVPAGVNDTVPLVPLGVNVCVCVPSAEPVNVGCVNVPAAIVGGFVGHEIAP
jgi:hypothetical protein